MNELGIKIRKEFCKIYKDDINKEESIEKYYSSFNKDKLKRIIEVYGVLEAENSLETLIALSKKEDIVKYIIENTYDIIRGIFQTINDGYYVQFERYLKEFKSNIVELDINNSAYSLHYIDFLNLYCFAKVKFIEEENKLLIYIPEEIKTIIKKLLKNKEIKNISKENTLYRDRVHNLLSTYGVIPLKELVKIYKKVYGKVDEKTLEDKIFINRIANEAVTMTEYEDEYLIFNEDFDNDDAIDFYNSIPKDLDYKIYEEFEYEEIGEGIYHENFEEFDILCDFLYVDLGMEDEEIDIFNENVIIDYIYSYQKDKDQAKKNLNSAFKNYYNYVTLENRMYISETILSIAREYPNFNYKGYSYKEYKEINNK